MPASTENKRRIIPPVYLLITLVLMWLVHFAFPLYQYIDEPLAYIGIIGVLPGIAMSAISAGAFRKAGTGIRPFEEATSLVTTGFYRFTRNPMYLGMFLMLIGVAILLGSIGAVFPAIVFIMIIRNNFVLGEEQFMEASFGQQYLDYKARVRRWL